MSEPLAQPRALDQPSETDSVAAGKTTVKTAAATSHIDPIRGSIQAAALLAAIERVEVAMRGDGVAVEFDRLRASLLSIARSLTGAKAESAHITAERTQAGQDRTREARLQRHLRDLDSEISSLINLLGGEIGVNTNNPQAAEPAVAASVVAPIPGREEQLAGAPQESADPITFIETPPEEPCDIASEPPSRAIDAPPPIGATEPEPAARVARNDVIALPYRPIESAPDDSRPEHVAVETLAAPVEDARPFESAPHDQPDYAAATTDIATETAAFVRLGPIFPGIVALDDVTFVEPMTAEPMAPEPAVRSTPTAEAECSETVPTVSQIVGRSDQAAAPDPDAVDVSMLQAMVARMRGAIGEPAQSAVLSAPPASSHFDDDDDPGAFLFDDIDPPPPAPAPVAPPPRAVETVTATEPKTEPRPAPKSGPATAHDPLAPIDALSEEEKIALFS